MTRLHGLISLRKWAIESGRKVIDHIDIMDISILILERTEQLVVLELRDIKNPREVAGHLKMKTKNDKREGKGESIYIEYRRRNDEAIP